MIQNQKIFSRVLRGTYLSLAYRTNKTFSFRTRINELRNLQYLPRLSEAREIMFEDRTKAHADHVGHGHDRMTTAAVGKIGNTLPIFNQIIHLIYLQEY